MTPLVCDSPYIYIHLSCNYSPSQTHLFACSITVLGFHIRTEPKWAYNEYQQTKTKRVELVHDNGYRTINQFGKNALQHGIRTASKCLPVFIFVFCVRTGECCPYMPHDGINWEWMYTTSHAHPRHQMEVWSVSRLGRFYTGKEPSVPIHILCIGRTKRINDIQNLRQTGELHNLLMFKWAILPQFVMF